MECICSVKAFLSCSVPQISQDSSTVNPHTLLRPRRHSFRDSAASQSLHGCGLTVCIEHRNSLLC